MNPTPSPLEIEPRPCVSCGLTIDRHQAVDFGEGLEFFCLPLDELTTPELEHRAELVHRIEVAAIVARMGMADPPSLEIRNGLPEPYRLVARDGVASAAELQRTINDSARQRRRVPQSTIDGLRYLLATGNEERIAAWLDDRPEYKSELLDLLARPT